MAGVAPEWDELCSSIRVPVTRREGETLYGTRSQTVLAMWSDGTAELQERNLDEQSGTWGPKASIHFSTNLQQCSSPS